MPHTYRMVCNTCIARTAWVCACCSSTRTTCWGENVSSLMWFCHWFILSRIVHCLSHFFLLSLELIACSFRTWNRISFAGIDAIRPMVVCESFILQCNTCFHSKLVWSTWGVLMLFFFVVLQHPFSLSLPPPSYSRRGCHPTPPSMSFWLSPQFWTLNFDISFSFSFFHLKLIVFCFLSLPCRLASLQNPPRRRRCRCRGLIVIPCFNLLPWAQRTSMSARIILAKSIFLHQIKICLPCKTLLTGTFLSVRVHQCLF